MTNADRIRSMTDEERVYLHVENNGMMLGCNSPYYFVYQLCFDCSCYPHWIK